jgi:hypothetical protein
MFTREAMAAMIAANKVTVIRFTKADGTETTRRAANWDAVPETFQPKGVRPANDKFLSFWDMDKENKADPATQGDWSRCTIANVISCQPE